jgi:hypothetical protein
MQLSISSYDCFEKLQRVFYSNLSQLRRDMHTHGIMILLHQSHSASRLMKRLYYDSLCTGSCTAAAEQQQQRQQQLPESQLQCLLCMLNRKHPRRASNFSTQSDLQRCVLCVLALPFLCCCCCCCRCCCSLDDVIRDKGTQLSPADVKAYMQMMLQGLAHVHGEGVVHRDVKPDNMLIGSNNALKLADFGLARWAIACWCVIAVWMPIRVCVLQQQLLQEHGPGMRWCHVCAYHMTSSCSTARPSLRDMLLT